MLLRALPWHRAKSGRGTCFGVHSHGLYYFAAGCTFMAIPSLSLSLIVVRHVLCDALLRGIVSNLICILGLVAVHDPRVCLYATSAQFLGVL